MRRRRCPTSTTSRSCARSAAPRTPTRRRRGSAATTSSFPRAELDRVTAAFGDFADLKSPWTLGHSRRVAALAGHAAPGLEHRDALVRSGHLHDLGCAAVPHGIRDKPQRLGAAEWERVRLHPHYTERILARTPARASLAPLAAPTTSGSAARATTAASPRPR